MDIQEAAGTGNIEAVKQHLADGVDVNAKDNYDYTPLLLAATWGHKEIVEQLIANGAVVNAKGVDGLTPLHITAGRGHKELVELFIAKGVDVNATNMYRITPLDWAIRYNLTKTAALLRKHGGKTGEELKAEGK